MKMESMLVRTLAKMAISTDENEIQVLRKECGDLLMELEGNVPTEPKKSTTDLTKVITNVVHDIGVPAHIKGYKYVKEAIAIVMTDKGMIDNITKGLYPAIAQKFDTTSSRVERTIRHAVEVAWDRGDMDTLQKYFGNTVSGLKGKPTNSEFIALISEHITINM